MPCDIQYYTEALIKLRNLIGDFEILVFGLGDLDANSFIPNEFLENCSFVTKADNSPDVESLILMSYAPALVTANSTFSWWSGNLASQKTIVIAPSKIFLNKHNPIDYYPQKWIKL
jgi:hypothetical protein